MRFLQLIIVASSILFSSCKLKPAEVPFEPQMGVFIKQTFSTDGFELPYRIYYPKSFNTDNFHPVLLFLHGAGERGNDNEAQLVHGSEVIASGMEKYNSIAVLPQCPEDDYWVRLRESERLVSGQRDFELDVSGKPSKALGAVIELVSDLKSKSYTDTARMYVAGLSMGGMGTFDILWRMPNTFAAAMPICGAGSPSKAGDVAKVPMRIFHGEEDAVVAVSESIQMHEAITKNGGTPELIIYPGVNHNSWDSAFAESDFVSWLFKHRLSQ